MQYERPTLTNLECIKKFCDTNFSKAVNSLTENTPNVRIRYVDLNGKFGFAEFGSFFFLEDTNCLYIISEEPQHKEFHNPDIFEYAKTKSEVEVKEKSGHYVIRAIFAGIFTGCLDNNGKAIFTGDVVRQQNLVAGVEVQNGEFSMILDNHHLPLSQTKELYVVGSLFYDLEQDSVEVDIRRLCNRFAQHATPRDKELIRKSPCFYF